MPTAPHLSFSRDADGDMKPALVRSGFASRATSLMALLIGSTALTGVALSLVGPAHAGTPQWLGTASSDWFKIGRAHV